MMNLQSRFRWIGWQCFVVAIWLAESASSHGDDPPSAVIELGNRLEPFVDRHLIARLKNCELRLHHPRPSERVFKFDRPWEGAFCGYVTVFEDEDRFRMYYRGLPRSGADGSDHEVTCYVESEDGVHWHKPDLGIYRWKDSSRNNIVLMGQAPASHNFSPFLDCNPDTPKEQRYKALGGGANGLLAFVSPDGINWKRLRTEPVFTQGVFDSQNVSFYSKSEKRYICYFRSWTQKNYRGWRTISRTTSPDFVHWSKPEEMSYGDTTREHLYTNQTNPYFRAPHIYLGIAARFIPGRRALSAQQTKQTGVDPKYGGDLSDAVLLSTRGGNRYDRTFMESFIRPGMGNENWTSRNNYPALGVVKTSDRELSIYVQKKYGQPNSHLRRYTLRLDGFASIHAGYHRGELLSRPLRFSRGNPSQNDQSSDRSTSLFLNASTSAAGSIKVELLDQNSKPIPGFTLEQCDPMIGDRIEHRMSWNGKTDLSSIANQSIQLRIELADADLFSIQFKQPVK